jgi:hypothetical protein
LVGLYRIAGIKTSSQAVILLNLAFADFLSSIHLLLLSVTDIHYRNVFASVAQTWRKSAMCKLMAVISSMSANVSLYMLTVLTLYRVIHIVYNYQPEKEMLISIVLLGWISNLLITIMPIVINIEYFKEFIQIDACLYFNFSPSITWNWQYGFIFFVMLNMVMLLLTVTAHAKLVCHVSKVRGNIQSMGMSNSRNVTRSMIAPLLMLNISNFLVWLPVMILSITALSGVDIPKSTSR